VDVTKPVKSELFGLLHKQVFPWVFVLSIERCDVVANCSVCVEITLILIVYASVKLPLVAESPLESISPLRAKNYLLTLQVLFVRKSYFVQTE
jgi:hypothetical protein